MMPSIGDRALVSRTSRQIARGGCRLPSLLGAGKRLEYPHMRAYETGLIRWSAILGVILFIVPSSVSLVQADPGVTMSANGNGMANAGANDPMAQVKNGVSDVIDVFKTPNTPLKVRREKLRELGAQYFDFESMTRS